MSGGSRGATRRRQLAPWFAVVGVLVVVALIAGSPSKQGGYLDPEGTGPTGLKALRTLLTSFGARVDVAYDPAPDADVMLMAADLIADEDLPLVEDWVADGGILVITDPWSAMTPAVLSSTFFPGSENTGTVSVGRCDIGALGSLRTLEFEHEPAMFTVGDGDRSCFGDGVDAHVVMKSAGAGAIVSVAGPDAFVNMNLGKGDNAGLAVALMAPQSGTRVVILERGANSPGGDPSLADAIPGGVQLAIVQLFVAFVFFAWFRGRRLGKPIVEHQPVQIEGSELVIAVGGLYRRSKNPAAAARVLRSDLRRRLASRLGLPVQGDPQVIVDAVATRTTLESERVMAAVGETPILDDAQLIDLARNIDSIQKEVLDGPV